VRGTRGHALSKAKAAAKRTKSRIRVRIEHVFGAQESAPGGRLVRTIGIVRARTKIGLQNFVHNIRRLATLERMAVALTADAAPTTAAVRTP
jgi:hypothetical protein